MTLTRKHALFLTINALLLMSSGHSLPAFSASTDNTSSGITDGDIASIKGEVGIAVVDQSRHRIYFLNQDKPFPMQSVCKFPLSIAILKLADQGKLSIQDKITVRLTDVVPYHSPIKDAIKGKQSDFTIRDLMTRAVCTSDNTACDVLIARAGGTKSVTALIQKAGASKIRIDRAEGQIQPDSVEIAKYLIDPRDTATPEGIVDALQKLYEGKLLSKASTTVLLEDLFNCETGQARLKAGLPAGWKLGHKTGTGRDVGEQNTATNDVGIAVGPHGETIYIAVFTKGSKAKIEIREALMAKVAAKAVAGELF
ncbi:class A beta-lactamase [soil metagenome]